MKQIGCIGGGRGSDVKVQCGTHSRQGCRLRAINSRTGAADHDKKSPPYGEPRSGVVPLCGDYIASRYSGQATDSGS